jgi:hypothetical protein
MAEPNDLPAPRTRDRDRHGRGPIHDIRRASGMRRSLRTVLQTERDDVVHQLAELDRQLLDLSHARRALVDQLADLRDQLYPPIPWCHGRRPPDLDVPPLPPATADPEVLVGRPLRAACRAILRRHGTTSLRELHGLLHRYGYVIGSRRPVAALSDAMRHEVGAGRAVRVARGVYDLRPGRERHRVPRRTSAWPLPRDHATYQTSGTTPLDPDVDEDPATWGFAPTTDPLTPDSVTPEGRH